MSHHQICPVPVRAARRPLRQCFGLLFPVSVSDPQSSSSHYIFGSRTTTAHSLRSATALSPLCPTCSACAIGIRSSSNCTLFFVSSLVFAIMVYTPEDLLIEISDRLRVMRTQETSQYFVPDYLDEEWQKELRGGTDQDEDSGSSQPTAAVPSSSSSSCDGNHSSSSDSDSINELWRGKICEWCYQVVDHFGKLILHLTDFSLVAFNKLMGSCICTSFSSRFQPRCRVRDHVLSRSLPCDAYRQSPHLPACGDYRALPRHQAV